MDYYLGIDCGGTFIKAALFDQQGTMRISVRESLAVISEKAGYAERDMAQLWSVCASVVKRAITESALTPDKIKGVGISAQGKGAFLLDQHKRPLGRAILSSDQRSLEIVRQWQQRGIPEKLYPLTRQTLWTGHPVSILQWIKQHEPQRYANIAYVLMSHDYLRFCLTGQLHCEETNISESNLYNMQQGDYDPALAELLDLTGIIEKLPPLIKPDQIAGYITPQAAQACGLAVGTPVVGGLFDVISTALCAGLDDEKKLNVVLGTWSVVSGLTDHIDQTQSIPFVYGRYAQADKFLVHEASPTSAGNLEWFIKQWNLDYQQINQGIAQLPPAASSVLFVPFLYGSNAGLGMQAGFYGIQSYHTQMHLMQAVYEGVLFSVMYHLTRMLERFPAVNTLRITGGPTKSAVWLQMLADLTGMTLEIPPAEETGCLGAALMAMQSAGENSVKLTGNMRKIQPNADNYPAYQQKYAQYVRLVEALKTLH
ncbi:MULTISPECIES: FGGY-family carbohydrate kinase [Pasteurellaceae]|uniref:FGGY-family carbohydrate kinase n=1 Tax=Pasteurellaceae TaxID=712 RepID=UPI0035635EF2